MNYLVASQVGSGTIPFTRGILPASQRGAQSTGGGIRTGMQTVIANPEDLIAVDAFVASGISVGTTPLKIYDKNMTLLPRGRQVMIQNGTDSSTLLIAHQAVKVVSEGWQLVNGAATVGARASVTLPVLDCVEIWAAASTGSCKVNILIF